MISIIYETKTEGKSLYVKAVVEDMICVFSGNRYDPPEYGPAICETTVELESDDVVPTNDDDLIDFLEDRNVNWKVIEIEEI